MVWQPGHLLNNGKYEILEVLGRGGFALTYKAHHCQLQMEVVIKTPDLLQKRDTEYEDYVKQFEAEGRKLAKFSQTPHPHIVRISDFFTEDKVPCLVMEFIRGQTLMDKVKTQGKLSEAECLKYIRQIGNALEEVHQAGMVHRDAHPGNIIIQPNGNAILIDFGIAKEIIPASSSSTDYAANPSFAPYEQIYKGSKANRQPSLDIYTLAASFYYAVTGQKPTPSMERRLENRPLKSPREINRNLSEHLSQAITLGMAVEKNDRPQSMSDWLQKLELSPPPVPPNHRQEEVNPRPKPKPPVNPKPSRTSVLQKIKDLPWGWLIGLFWGFFAIGFLLSVESFLYQQIIAVAVAMAIFGAGVVSPLLFGLSPLVFFAITVFIAWDVAWYLGISIVFGVVSVIMLVLAVDQRRNTSFFDAVGIFMVMISPGLMSGTVSAILARDNHISAGMIMGTIFELLFLLNVLFIGTVEKHKKIPSLNIFLILASTNLSGLGSGWLWGFWLFR